MFWNCRKPISRKGARAATARAGLIAAILLSAAGQTAQSQPVEDPDWPCIQRKVPEISPGMVWAGPPLDAAAASWRDDPEIAALAMKIASRRTPIEEANAAIKELAEAAGADEDKKLTMLFAGALGIINHDRASIMSGIQRYATRQRALADKIERQSAQLAALPVEETPPGVTSERDDLLEVQNWDIRIFEEREHALTYVCEQPVLLEQRAFALGREIMKYLD
ncbi:hypothetical protein [Rhodospirillaceae bacterium SYSU D60014]|uniref:hypothetical protein n=1 Tax=Virgifigura deserti TaxID=2268457 RepID=UPI000E66C77D